MDQVLNYVDDTCKVSITDSTMMRILHCSMNRTQQKMKSRKGVLERLNEISKFYEFAVMQLEGCLTFVHLATDDRSIHESSHEEVLLDLADIRDRLQGRLEECEMAISEKDRELAARSESELNLRQALDSKERDVVSLQDNIKLEIARCENIEELIANEGLIGDEDKDRDSCYLKNTVDQQVWNIRQKLEPSHSKVEQMGSDIGILKETLDQAFGKMQSAVIGSEMGPVEQQWRWNIEKDITSTLTKGFIEDCKANFNIVMKQKEHIDAKWRDSWSNMINEFRNLRYNFERLINQNESRGASPVTSICDLNEDKSRDRTPSESCSCSNENSESEDHEEGENEKHYVAKMIKSHESIIRKKTAELNRLNREIMLAKKWTSLKKEREILSLRGKIQDAILKMDKLIDANTKMVDPYDHLGVVYREMSFPVMKELSKIGMIHNVKFDIGNSNNVGDETEVPSRPLTKSKREMRMVMEEKDLHTMILGGTHLSSHRGLEEELDSQSDSSKLEKLNCESKDFLKEEITRYKNRIKCYEMDWKIREEILCIVFGEIVRYSSCLVNSVSIAYQEDNSPDKLCDTCSCAESVIREDTCELFLRNMIEEWKIRMEDHQMEILMWEELHQLILVEFIKEAYKESMPPTKHNARENKTSLTILDQDLKVQREHRLIKLFRAILKCVDAEEDLVLSARCEMREHSKELDLGSERDFLHEHEIFEDLFAEEEETCYSVANKLEKALHQLARGKELLYELGSTLGLRPCGLARASSLPTRACSLEKTRDRVSPVLSIAQSSSHSQQKHNEERRMNPFASLFFCLMGFPLVFAAFEQMVIEKLSATAMRLRETKCCLHSLVQLVACVQKKEALYKTAFIKRCQNLQKAETEVDMLGDQVDVLLSLLEKTYATLHPYAPVLEQYFEASVLLELIKKEILLLSC